MSASLPRVPTGAFSSITISSAQGPAWAEGHRRVTHRLGSTSSERLLPRLQLLSLLGFCENTHLLPAGTGREHRLISSFLFLFHDQNIYGSVSGAGSSPNTLLLIVNVTFNIDDVGYSCHTWMSY